MTTTLFFTDTDIKTLKKNLKQGRLTLYKLIILFICLSFIIPLLPGRVYRDYPKGILSNYWVRYVFVAIGFLLASIILTIGNNSIKKKIKTGLINNKRPVLLFLSE